MKFLNIDGVKTLWNKIITREYNLYINVKTIDDASTDDEAVINLYDEIQSSIALNPSLFDNMNPNKINIINIMGQLSNHTERSVSKFIVFSFLKRDDNYYEVRGILSICGETTIRPMYYAEMDLGTNADAFTIFPLNAIDSEIAR